MWRFTLFAASVTLFAVLSVVAGDCSEEDCSEFTNSIGDHADLLLGNCENDRATTAGEFADYVESAEREMDRLEAEILRLEMEITLYLSRSTSYKSHSVGIDVNTRDSRVSSSYCYTRYTWRGWSACAGLDYEDELGGTLGSRKNW